MNKVVVAWGECPICGHRSAAILDIVKLKYGDLCPRHGYKQFKVGTAGFYTEEEAKELVEKERNYANR